ncbi:hypothetical protein GCM10028784_07470 [Myceligenerans cantabricum]
MRHSRYIAFPRRARPLPWDHVASPIRTCQETPMSKRGRKRKDRKKKSANHGKRPNGG